MLARLVGIKVLKELSQIFVFNLTKSNLVYYYKQCIDGLDEIRLP